MTFGNHYESNLMTMFNPNLNQRYLHVKIDKLDELETLLFYKYYHKNRIFQSVIMPAKIFHSHKVEANTIQVLRQLDIKELKISDISRSFDLENVM